MSRGRIKLQVFKVIAVGDGSVGKTSITVSFGEEDKDIKLQIWDTGGQERFSPIRELYYKGALGAVVVFDVTGVESFDHVPNWFAEIRKNVSNIPITLVGNKIDLPNRVISCEEGVQMGRKCAAPYRETSARTGDCVDEVFLELSYRILLSLYGPPIVNGQTVVGLPKGIVKRSSTVETEK
jgi:small GTP-binding protein